KPLTGTNVVPALNLTTVPGGHVTVTVGPDPDGDGALTAPTHDLAYTGTLFRASGYVRLVIGDFVSFAGQLAFEKGSTITGMKLSDGTAAGDLTALKLSATGVNIFAGTGGPY